MSTNTDQNVAEETEVKDVAATPATRPIELGTEDRPYPMIMKVQNEYGRFVEELGVLADGSLKINSERSEDEVLGMAYRDMPSPGMLKLFLDGSTQRETDDPRKVEFMMGDPGAGKSFLANLHAKMRTGRGALLVDCGGRDLSELLYETVLDFEGGKSLYQEIDAKLAAGTMSAPSIQMLQDALGSSMTRDGDSYAIDWTAFNGSDHRDAASEEGLSDEEIAIKREADRAQQKETMEAALTTLERVAGLEGLGKGGDVSIGLTTKEGPIIRAWRENRPLILDEYNKAKPGTDDALQILWQVFNGEMQEHIVKGGGGKSFTFSRDEMPDKFFVTLTGNLTKDGYSTRQLSSSAYQRLQPQYIAAPSVEDWQHRICQKLTGMPVSTIYKANESYWSENPEAFTDYLVDLRKKGLSEDQQANIPSWQFAMLKNWENVLSASEQLSEFYDHWAQVTDPNSKLHADAADGKNSEKIANLLEEIDDKYSAEIGVGLRRMLRHVDKTTIISPQPRMGGAIGERKDRSERVEEPTERFFGTRLARNILEDLNATAEGRDALLDYLLVKAAETGGLFEMAGGDDSVATKKSTIADLLDIDPEKKVELPGNIQEIHDMLCDYIRTKHSDLELSDDNADLISETKLHHVLSELGGQKNVQRLTSRSGVLKLPNLEPGLEEENAQNSFHDRPFTDAVGVESMPLKDPKDWENEVFNERFKKIKGEERGLTRVAKLPTEELVDSERFLISLAVPGVKQNNIDALFPKYNLEARDLIPSEDNTLMIVNNTSETGLAVNLLLCKSTDAEGKEQDEYLYVIHDSTANKGEGRTVITGTTEISPKLQAALEKSEVSYVNRSDENAKELLDKALDTLTANKSELPSNEMCIDQMLTSAMALFRTNISYDMLPHPELLNGDTDNRYTRNDEFYAKHRTNLTSLLLDEGEYLEKSAGQRTPFLLTDTQDISELKHSLKELSKGSANQRTAMTR